MIEVVVWPNGASCVDHLLEVVDVADVGLDQVAVLAR